MKLKLATLLFAACPLAAQAQDCPPLVKIASVKLEPLANSRRVIVPVTINNVPKKFLLDTAGLAGFITKESADELKLPSLSFSSNVRPIKTFGLGGRKFELPATDDYTTTLISPQWPTTSDRDGDIDGTLVNSFLLNKGELDIDFPGKTLSLFSPDHCPGNVNHWGAADIGFLPLSYGLVSAYDVISGVPERRYTNWEHDVSHLTVPVTLDGHLFNAWIDTSAEKSWIRHGIASRIFNIKPEQLGPSYLVKMDPQAVLGFYVPVGRATTTKVYRRRFLNLSIGHVDIKNFELLIASGGAHRSRDWLREIIYSKNYYLKSNWRNDPASQYGHSPGYEILNWKKEYLSENGFRPGKRSKEAEDKDIPDMVLGMDVLRHLHIYLSLKEKRMYFSAASTPPPPPTPIPVNTAPVLAPPSQEIPVSRPLPPIGPPPSSPAADAAFKDAKLKCAELGFKAGTEKYGTCVLTLSK